MPTSLILTQREISLLRISDRAYLAPAFRLALEKVLAAMKLKGHDPEVYETLRLARLQAHYYATGASSLQGPWAGWHEFGLAADVISASKDWDAPKQFWEDLATLAEHEGLVAGYRWKKPFDPPHLQWGKPMNTAPTDRARELLKAGGLTAVWAEVGALVPRK